jgi:hypothetical protein
MSTTDKSRNNTPDGTSTQSGLDVSSSSRLCRATIRQAVEDAVRGKGRIKREAMAYFSSERFVLDCRSVGADHRVIGQLVVRILDLPEAEQSNEVAKMKAAIRS